MRFRWVAFLTLWTFLSGPILALPVKGERPPVVPMRASADRKAPTGEKNDSTFKSSIRGDEQLDIIDER